MLYFDFTFYIPAHSNGKGLIEPYEEDFDPNARISYNLIGTNHDIQIGFETFKNLKQNIYVKCNGFSKFNNHKINFGYGDSNDESCVYHLRLSGYGRNLEISTS